ncbi:MAG: hypothetical protein ACNA8W_14800, partial [Bradymonadaceae bacterium]
LSSSRESRPVRTIRTPRNTRHRRPMADHSSEFSTLTGVKIDVSRPRYQPDPEPEPASEPQAKPQARHPLNQPTRDIHSTPVGMKARQDISATSQLTAVTPTGLVKAQSSTEDPPTLEFSAGDEAQLLQGVINKPRRDESASGGFDSIARDLEESGPVDEDSDKS